MLLLIDFNFSVFRFDFMMISAAKISRHVHFPDKFDLRSHMSRQVGKDLYVFHHKWEENHCLMLITNIHILLGTSENNLESC